MFTSRVSIAHIAVPLPGLRSLRRAQPLELLADPGGFPGVDRSDHGLASRPGR